MSTNLPWIATGRTCGASLFELDLAVAVLVLYEA